MRAKIKKDFFVKTIAGESVLIGSGEQIDFSQMLILNDTAAFMVKELQAAPATAAELAEKTAAAYDVSPDRARADAEELLEDLARPRVTEADAP